MSPLTRRSMLSRAGVLALAALVAWGSEASAQQARESGSLRIGILSTGELENRRSLEEALLQGLREQGYVEGRNLVIERRYGTRALADNAAALGGMNLDAVLTTCTPSTRTMKSASASIPIVMAGVSDPVRQGVIASLARPGQNVTGTTSQAEDLLGKRLEQVAAVLPHRPIVAIVMNANNPVHALGWERMQPAAQALGLTLRKVELRQPEDLVPAIEGAKRAQAGALFVMPDDPVMFNLRPKLVALAASHRLPDFYWERSFVESGGLLSYGEDLRSSYHAGAAYMSKIKKGELPGELPVQQPTRFDLVVNLQAARARGVTIPDVLLLRADDVIR